MFSEPHTISKNKIENSSLLYPRSQHDIQARINGSHFCFLDLGAHSTNRVYVFPHLLMICFDIQGYGGVPENTQACVTMESYHDSYSFFPKEPTPNLREAEPNKRRRTSQSRDLARIQHKETS